MKEPILHIGRYKTRSEDKFYIQRNFVGIYSDENTFLTRRAETQLDPYTLATTGCNNKHGPPDQFLGIRLFLQHFLKFLVPG